MEEEYIKVYTKNGSLIIDSRTTQIRNIILYQNIEAIITFPVNEAYGNEMLICLSKKSEYENLGNLFFHKILYFIHWLFHKNKKLISMRCSDNELLLILNEIKKNLSNVNIPSLDKGIFLNEVSNDNTQSQVKLVYSKFNLGLSDVLKKYK